MESLPTMTRIPHRRGENGTLVRGNKDSKEGKDAKVKAIHESVEGSPFRFSKEARFPYRGLPLDLRDASRLGA